MRIKHISLTIEHNPNVHSSRTVEQYIDDHNTFGAWHHDWESPEHEARAIATNELWTMAWYPTTIVGFMSIAAPTYPELIQFAERVSAEEDEKAKSEATRPNLKEHWLDDVIIPPKFGDQELGEEE